MQISKSKIFLFCCLAFIFGIGIASFFSNSLIQNNILWFCFVVSFIVILILFWKNKKIRLIAFVGLFLFCGILRYSISLPINNDNKIWHYNGQTVNIIGVISKEPDIRQKNQKLTIKTKYINKKNISGKILVTTNLYPKYNYGDKLKIKCKLQAPEEFNGFAYDRYLSRYNIYSVCYYSDIVVINKNKTNNIKFVLYNNILKLKNKFRKSINFGLPEPQASLAKAIVIGDKKGISDNLREQFSRAGISHIMAISGMHITILSVIIMWIFFSIGCSRKYAFLLSVLFLILYILLIGVPASAVRAGIMGFLVMFSLYLGRLNSLNRSLIFTAVILLLINPKLLRDDIGFQLSFLAVFGISYLFPKLNKWSDKIGVTGYKKIKNMFFITISAQIFTFPILMINFSQISLISPITNLLVIWTLPLLIISIIIAVILSFIFPFLSIILFAPSYLILLYIMKISELLIKIPFSYLNFNI